MRAWPFLVVASLVGCGEPAPTPIPEQPATIVANKKKEIDKATPGQEPSEVAVKLGYTVLELAKTEIIASGVERWPIAKVNTGTGKTDDGEKVQSYWVDLKDFRVRINLFGPLRRGLSVVGESLSRETFSMEWFDWIDGKMRQRVGGGQIRVEQKNGKPWRFHFDEGLDVRICPYTGREDVGNPIWLLRIHKGSFFTFPIKGN